MHRTRNAVRLVAGGGLAIAALTGTATLASASNDYAPSTPPPTVTTPVPPEPSAPPQGETPQGETPQGETPRGETPRGETPSTDQERPTAPARAIDSSGDELAYTGADVLPWAAAGSVLVLGGTAMVVASKRSARRQH
ncbi:hypothetical protein MO973_17755 [Paenibacillus sp. TRM 82003]|uniref:hypothetical protein n=1 Tax=Kineococcus sp. TRM81007 TaxID=2925831 RepID=UPI001F55CDF7|nr:hypothetical protein [Kineococcus sp. TRM81007]MCI2238412.1 hypothetical protein [Kineococcus sp. TRM81007]MCI3922075.1 hypothetical protein [Paenibacillus sp. TRM 82003]